MYCLGEIGDLPKVEAVGDLLVFAVRPQCIAQLLVVAYRSLCSILVLPPSSDSILHPVGRLFVEEIPGSCVERVAQPVGYAERLLLVSAGPP